MSEESLKARRLWEDVFPAMDMEAVAEIVAVDCVDHAARPGEPQGIEGVCNTMRFLDSAFSNQRFEVQRTVEQGDTVVIHLIHKGIQTGELMGIPPTRREFAYEHIHILRFEDGRAVSIGVFTTISRSCSSSARCELARTRRCADRRDEAADACVRR